MEGMVVDVDYWIDKGIWTCRGIEPRYAASSLTCIDDLKADFAIIVKMTAEEGETIEKKYDFKAGTKHGVVLREIVKSFQKPIDGKEYWSVYESYGRHNLEVQGFIKEDKFFAVEKLEVTCPQMKVDEQPPVRQLNQNWNLRRNK